MQLCSETFVTSKTGTNGLDIVVNNSVPRSLCCSRARRNSEKPCHWVGQTKGKTLGKRRQMGYVLGLARQRENTKRVYQRATKNKKGGCCKKGRDRVSR